MTRKLLIALTLLAGCTTAAADGGSVNSSVDAKRGPLGKADAIGSCAASDCDGQAEGGNCWCDDMCAEFGDCCTDRVDVCEAPVSQTCGGLAGSQCDDGFYCDYGSEARCGLADQTGVCREIPTTCTGALAPVCGCNGVTYTNSCDAAHAGMSVGSEGVCEGDTAPAATCGGQLARSCGDESFCSYEPDAACGVADAIGTCEARPQACSRDYKPVCGCDSHTYNNACEANMAGTTVAADGACGG